MNESQQNKLADALNILQRWLGSEVEMLTLLVKEANGHIGIVHTQRLDKPDPPEGNPIGQFLVDALAAYAKQSDTIREFAEIVNLETGERRVLRDKK